MSYGPSPRRSARLRAKGIVDDVPTLPPEMSSRSHPLPESAGALRLRTIPSGVRYSAVVLPVNLHSIELSLDEGGSLHQHKLGCLDTVHWLRIPGWMKKLLIPVVRALAAALLLTNAYLVFYPLTCAWWELSDPIARFVFFADPQIEGTDKKRNKGTIGAIDVAFNDAYIHHVYRSMIWLKKPTHVVVLGDLFSSQWISDEEFGKRVNRYKSIFGPSTAYSLYPDGQFNGPLLINITGNHDVGYESDLTEARLDRWEADFGAANFQFWIAKNENSDDGIGKQGIQFGSVNANERTISDDASSVHFVVINSMVLDGAKTESLHNQTWGLVDSVAEERRKYSISGKPVPPLVILTHIPLYKRQNICMDAPMTFWDGNGAIVEQNMLSRETSHRLVTTLRPSWIFAGHDHEGCETQRTVWRRKIQRTSLEQNSTLFGEGVKGEVKERDQLGGYSSRWVESENQTFHEHPEDGLGGNPIDTWDYREHVQKLSVAAAESRGTTNDVWTEGDHVTTEENAWEMISDTREVTVRSVMGELAGHAGIWEFGYKNSSGLGDIEFRYHGCSFVQHPFVWAVLILDVVGIVIGGCLIMIWRGRRKQREEKKGR